jgi:hypothetical protein
LSLLLRRPSSVLLRLLRPRDSLQVLHLMHSA